MGVEIATLQSSTSFELLPVNGSRVAIDAFALPAHAQMNKTGK